MENIHKKIENKAKSLQEQAEALIEKQEQGNFSPDDKAELLSLMEKIKNLETHAGEEIDKIEKFFKDLEALEKLEKQKLLITKLDKILALVEKEDAKDKAMLNEAKSLLTKLAQKTDFGEDDVEEIKNMISKISITLAEQGVETPFEEEETSDSQKEEKQQQGIPNSDSQKETSDIDNSKNGDIDFADDKEKISLDDLYEKMNYKEKSSFRKLIERNEIAKKSLSVAGNFGKNILKGLAWFGGSKIGKTLRNITYSENKWKRLGKRIVFSGVIGFATGGGSIAITALSGLSGITASYVHEKVTRKKVKKKISVVTKAYLEDLDNRNIDTNRDLGKYARDRKLIRELRKAKKEGNIDEEEESLLNEIERIRNERAKEIKHAIKDLREKRDLLREEIINKNKRNNVLITSLITAITGLSLRYGPQILNATFDTNFSDRFGLISNREIKSAAVELMDKSVDKLDDLIENIEKPIQDLGHSVEDKMNDLFGHEEVSKLDNNIKTGENSSLEAKELEAKELEAKELEAKELEAKELEAKELEAKELEAKELEAKELEAKELEAKELEAKELEAKELEAKKLVDPKPDKIEIKSETIIAKDGDGFTQMVDKLSPELKAKFGIINGTKAEWNTFIKDYNLEGKGVYLKGNYTYEFNNDGTFTQLKDGEIVNTFAKNTTDIDTSHMFELEKTTEHEIGGSAENHDIGNSNAENTNNGQGSNISDLEKNATQIETESGTSDYKRGRAIENVDNVDNVDDAMLDENGKTSLYNKYFGEDGNKYGDSQDSIYDSPGDINEDIHKNGLFNLDNEHRVPFEGRNNPWGIRDRHMDRIMENKFNSIIEVPYRGNSHLVMQLVKVNNNFILEMDGKNIVDAKANMQTFLKEMGFHAKDSKLINESLNGKNISRAFTRLTNEQAEYLYKNMKHLAVKK